MWVGLVYKTLGTLNMAEAAAYMGSLNPSVLSLVMVFMFAGIFVELEVFPFNIWVPNAYLSSKTSVTLMLHGILGTAAAYMMARILVTLFSVDGNGMLADSSLRHMIVVIAILTMLISHISAYGEKKLKKVLAFSSMGQMGLMLFAFMVGSKEAVAGVFFIVIANYVSKLILLMLAGEYSQIVGSDNWVDMKGLGRKYPLSAISFIVAVLTVMGMPLFAGFWGKLGILQGAVQGDGLFLAGAVAILIAAVLEGVYLLKIAHTLFLEKEAGTVFQAEPRKMVVGITIILASAAILIGIYPGLFENTFNMMSAEILESIPNYIEVVFPGGV
jgi:multicomponent Na+:H+ antiporter subunit D